MLSPVETFEKYKTQQCILKMLVYPAVGSLTIPPAPVSRIETSVVRSRAGDLSDREMMCN